MVKRSVVMFTDPFQANAAISPSCPPSAINRDRLSPFHHTYLQKILQSNIGRLKSKQANSPRLEYDQLNDLNVVLATLYLTYSELNAIIQELEDLSALHHSLQVQGIPHPKQLCGIEQRIFWLFGAKLCDVDRQKTIFIIDSDPFNLSPLAMALARQGYEVHCDTVSSRTLEIVSLLKPDLILLNSLILERASYAVYKKLKNNPETRNIDIMLFSLIDNNLDEQSVLDIDTVNAGRNLPQIEAVLAHVENQLNLRSLKRQIKEHHARLQQVTQERHHAEERYRSVIEKRSYCSKAIDDGCRVTRIGRSAMPL